MELAFQAWPKTPRLFRDIVITEKIDGTNAAIQIHEVNFGESLRYENKVPITTVVSGEELDEDGFPLKEYIVLAQSRKRLISPLMDNFGFAAWVYANAAALVRTLGPGVHFGEWWGSGIQRGYGLPKGEKRFSLFNVKRYDTPCFNPEEIPGLGVVPVLFKGVFSEDSILWTLDSLQMQGSAAADFPKPEGIVIYHTQSGQVYKVLIENDEVPKSLVGK